MDEDIADAESAVAEAESAVESAEVALQEANERLEQAKEQRMRMERRLEMVRLFVDQHQNRRSWFRPFAPADATKEDVHGWRDRL
jgi:chromosome segregation ATPase